ncbi:MAG: hypothetical protein AAGF04_02745 [Chlamydiota bacterium]
MTTDLSNLDIFLEKHKKKQEVSTEINIDLSNAQKAQAMVAAQIAIHLHATLEMIQPGKGESVTGIGSVTGSHRLGNGQTAAHSPATDTMSGGSADALSSPFSLFGKLSELQGLTNDLKQSASSVSSAAISASSPTGSKGGPSKKSGASEGKTGGSLGESGGGPDFPTNDPNYPPSPYDPNDIPQGENNIYSEYQNWLRAIRSSSNPNTLFAFLQWLTNLANTPGDADIANKLCNDLAKVTSDSGESFAEMIVDALRDSWYYTGNYDVKDEMSKLAQMFQGLAGENDLFRGISNYATNDYNGIDEWIDKQKSDPPPIPDGDFFYYQAGQLYDWFHENSSLRAQLHKWFMEQINKLVARFQDNPEILITLIFTALGGSMNNMQYQYGDYGTLDKRLEDLTNKMSDIQKEFADISDGQDIDANELKKMTEQIKQLQYEVTQLNKMFGSSIMTSTNNALGKILGIKVNDNGTTLGQLADQNNPDWQGAANYIKDHNILYNPGSQAQGDEKPPGPTDLTTEIQNAIRTAQTTYTSQSQAIGTQMQELSQRIQTTAGVINSMVNKDYKNWVDQEVRNQIQP